MFLKLLINKSNFINKINPLSKFINKRLLLLDQIQQSKQGIYLQKNYYSIISRNLFQDKKPILLLSSSTVNDFDFLQKRFKKKKASASSSSKKQSKQRPVKDEDDDLDDNEEDSDDDDTGDADDSLIGDDPDTKIINTTVISCRLDAIGKTCFNMPRAKFDECFYSNLIRVNGERVGKKSNLIRDSDIIDLIRGFSMNDSKKLEINRVEILKLDDKAASSGRYRIQFKKVNKLLIDNYPNDPYDGTLIST